MKNFQKTVAVMMAFITILALLPISAFASYKDEPLKYNYWYSLKEDVSTVYRVKVTADTILTVNWKNNRGEFGILKRKWLLPTTRTGLKSALQKVES